MARQVTLTNGVTFSIPDIGDVDYTDLPDFLEALGNAILKGSVIETSLIITTPVTVTVNNGATHTPGQRQTFFISGNGGPVKLSTTTPIAPGVAPGARLTLVGTSDTNTVEIPDSGDININGRCTLRKDDAIEMLWTGSRWTEISRNN